MPPYRSRAPPRLILRCWVATYLRQRGEFVALNYIPESSHLVVDTERGFAAASASIIERLRGLGHASD